MADIPAASSAFTLHLRNVLLPEGHFRGAIQILFKRKDRRCRSDCQVEKTGLRASMLLAVYSAGRYELWDHLHMQGATF